MREERSWKVQYEFLKLNDGAELNVKRPLLHPPYSNMCHPCVVNILGELEQFEVDLAKSKASEEEMKFKYREADIKLNTLQDYFKNMENDLHR